MNNLQKEIKKTFFQTLEDIKTKENFEKFLSDFLYPEELNLFIKRLAIAYWLNKKRSYENIKSNLNTTTKEIKEVENKINTQGYKLALKQMEAEEWANKWSEKIIRFTKQ